MAQLVGNLMVGNLLIDPEATSFISLEDADTYLAEEKNKAWDAAASNGHREGALISASRWLAMSLPWVPCPLTEAGLSRVAAVTARLAAVALTVDLWEPETIGKQAKRYKAGSVEIEYQAAGPVRGAVAGGRRFGWIYPMLRGLIGTAGQHDVARR
jgi:hypothetical protein